MQTCFRRLKWPSCWLGYRFFFVDFYRPLSVWKIMLLQFYSSPYLKGIISELFFFKECFFFSIEVLLPKMRHSCAKRTHWTKAWMKSLWRIGFTSWLGISDLAMFPEDTEHVIRYILFYGTFHYPGLNFEILGLWNYWNRKCRIFLR